MSEIPARSPCIGQCKKQAKQQARLAGCRRGCSFAAFVRGERREADWGLTVPPPPAPKMGKQRMTLLDLRASVAELRAKLKGLRLANVYDVNPRTYLLKFSKPGTKLVLLVESGTRVHTTSFSRDKNAIPSGFTMKLRKHIRTRRLEGIATVGADRIFDMTFGTGEAQYHLICELYDRGNIVLTDRDYTILTLLRAHKYDSSAPVTMFVGGKYQVGASQQIRALGLDELRQAVASGASGKNLGIKQLLSECTGGRRHCSHSTGAYFALGHVCMLRGQGLAQVSGRHSLSIAWPASAYRVSFLA
jgi:hypothetical protein